MGFNTGILVRSLDPDLFRLDPNFNPDCIIYSDSNPDPGFAESKSKPKFYYQSSVADLLNLDQCIRIQICFHTQVFNVTVQAKE